jgi:hypothetical protein
MSTQTHESVPTIWLDGRDVPFFRLTAQLFSPAFAAGAGVLLASYDIDDGPAGAALPASEEKSSHDTTMTTRSS